MFYQEIHIFDINFQKDEGNVVMDEKIPCVLQKNTSTCNERNKIYDPI